MMSDDRRVIIIDVTHMFYKFAFGSGTPLQHTLMVDGKPVVVDTTLPTHTIKQIHRWSRGGYNPVVVCFDGKGSLRSRKVYFTQGTGASEKVSTVDYKEGRQSQDGRFYEGINMTMNLLNMGGVCCLKCDGYEADDLVMAAVQLAKEQYPDLPIDVITGDVDLAPLVDDRVSVFLSSRKMTWAEDKSIEKLHYMQLRPYNFSEYIEGLTDYKKLSIPYNMLLLAKLLRGDKSDRIPGYPKFTPTKFNKLIQQLEEDGHNMDELCRYDAPIPVVRYRGTGDEIPKELIESTPAEQKVTEFLDPPCLTNLLGVLCNYLDEDIIKHIRYIYNGINLNGVFAGLPDGYNRPPAVLSTDIKGYSPSVLQQMVSKIGVNLPVV